MNYIKRVAIENFQSHEKTELEFEPGLNVIIGPTDQGKSAIIRAIKWALFNEPRGSEFIRYGTSYAKVEIEINNGFKIVRERSSSKNRYTIIDPEGTTQSFEGFGNSVPEEVKNVHGISKVMIDSDSNVCLNIGEQLEGPFLLSQTGSIKAKAIGRLTGVHIIDNAIRECVVDIKRENQQQTKIKKELDEIEQKLEEFKDLDETKKKIENCESLVESVDVLNQRFEKMSNYESLYQKIESERLEFQRFITSMDNVDYAEKVMDKIIDKTDYYNKIRNINAVLESVNEGIKQQENLLQSSENIDKAFENIMLLEKTRAHYESLINANEKYLNLNSEMHKIEKELQQFNGLDSAPDVVKRIGELVSLCESLERVNASYKSVARSIQEGEKYLSQVRNEIKLGLNEYGEVLKKVSKCPVCFNDIDKTTIERVLRQYEEVAE